MSTPKLAQDDQEMIDRFLAAYNAIDKALRTRLKPRPDKSQSFVYVVDQYARRYPSWGDGQILKQYADLRNFIVHEQTRPQQPLAVPTRAVVQTIEQVLERLNRRATIGFGKKKVVSFELDDPLSKVLKTIGRTDFSQFPVYDTGHEFRGVLTENGITRWLANHISKIALVDFDEERVRTVLKEEEPRKNYLFVPRDSSVDEVTSEFAHRPLLEVVLITQNGRSSERLLGLATRWDILKAAEVES